MAVLSILLYPHATLLETAKTVNEMNDDIRQLADDMLQTMQAAKGIGLAAPQVGRSERLIVVDADGITAVLANPKIIAMEDTFDSEEGCLSIPGITALIKRAHKITVSGLDMDGNIKTIEAEELPAACLQHEIDHLNGILLFDRVSALKKMRLKHKYKKLRNKTPD